MKNLDDEDEASAQHDQRSYKEDDADHEIAHSVDVEKKLALANDSLK